MIPVLLGGELPGSSGAGGTGTTVVVVDDHADFRWLVRRSLERDGDFAVLAEAADGLSGVDAVRAHAPQLVLLDLEMPRMDGIAALTAIRRDSPSTRVVVLTAGTSGARLDAALAGGAAGVIRKGSSLANMITQLRDLLGRTPLAVIEAEPVDPLPA